MAFVRTISRHGEKALKQWTIYSYIYYAIYSKIRKIKNKVYDFS